jgi:hypothetical protein
LEQQFLLQVAWKMKLQNQQQTCLALVKLDIDIVPEVAILPVAYIG